MNSIQLGRDMLRTPPLDAIYQGENEPGPDVKTEEDLTKWAVKVSSSDNHVIGSLAMMPKELGGVVDTRLRLYGAQNVRIVGEHPPFFCSGMNGTNLPFSSFHRCVDHSNAHQCTSCKHSIIL